MIKLVITENEENQRLDRFLRKYLKNAPLSHIYKLIRKDIKINGKRGNIETILSSGDEISIYINEEELELYKKAGSSNKAKRQFKVAYEDEQILIVEKPFGLLTHGDATEKKNTLANQVIGYLTEQGTYIPRMEKTFIPSPVNRLDRNTTGLVIFGKTAAALRSLNKMLRERGYVSKYYLTIVAGKLDKELILKDKMEKDSRSNTVKVKAMEEVGGKVMETIARPIMTKNGFTLVEVELVTGRTHQIRVHLEKAGYPVIGDAKYGDRRVNQRVSRKYDLSTQFLHAHRLIFHSGIDPLTYLEGLEVICPLTDELERIKICIFD